MRGDRMMIELKTLLCAAAGAAGGAAAWLLGGWDADIAVLIVFMAVDFVMGLLLAAVFGISSKSANGALESRACFKGLCRKITVLCCVMIGCQLDRMLGQHYIRTATIIGFSVNELISVTENAGLMGIPMPASLIKAIEILKSKDDNNAEN